MAAAKKKNLAQQARAQGLTRDQFLQRRQHLMHVHDLQRTATAQHPWNKPGLSYAQKRQLRDAHLRHKSFVAWRHTKSADAAEYQAAVEYAGSTLPPDASKFLSSFIGPDQGDSAAPRTRDNLLLIGVGVVVLWWVIKHRKKG